MAGKQPSHQPGSGAKGHHQPRGPNTLHEGADVRERVGNQEIAKCWNAEWRPRAERARRSRSWMRVRMRHGCHPPPSER
jgi:hypothetical protein